MALELTAAEYREQGVALDLTVRNDSDHAIVVERKGILLGYKALEFPVDVADAMAPAASITVPAGGSTALRLAFVTGSVLREASTLRMRAIRSGERWLSAGRISVPPVPPATGAGDQRRRTKRAAGASSASG